MSWWNSSWDRLEAETVDSIKRQPPTPKRWGTMWACGCEESLVSTPRISSLHICLWHEGYDEGVAATKEVLRGTS